MVSFFRMVSLSHSCVRVIKDRSYVYGVRDDYVMTGGEIDSQINLSNCFLLYVIIILIITA